MTACTQPGTEAMSEQNIRFECLRPAADGWVQPTGDEVREVLRRANLSGSRAADVLGLGSGGGRTVRRWTGEETPIPYAVWAILCDLAGFERIWRKQV